MLLNHQKQVILPFAVVIQGQNVARATVKQCSSRGKALSSSLSPVVTTATIDLGFHIWEASSKVLLSCCVSISDHTVAYDLPWHRK